MTIIAQTPLILFAPILTATPVIFVEAASTIEPGSFLQLTTTDTTTTAHHNDYLFSGINLGNLSVSYSSVPNGVDISEFPLIKRGVGINESVEARFSNGRAETENIRLVFGTSGSITYRQATGGLPGTYAEYSLNAVTALFSQLTSPSMFTAAPVNNRALPLIIPHQHFTGHVFHSSGWGTLASGPNDGRRFSAITPRHVIGCAHYGGSNYKVGTKLYWKTTSNELVERTVIAAWSGFDQFSSVGSDAFFPGQMDFAMFLLDSPLPASIKPFPIAGDWHRQRQPSSTTITSVDCPQLFGVFLFNNDGHITPFQATPFSIQTRSMPGLQVVTVGGVEYNAENSVRNVWGFPLDVPGHSYNYWSASDPFYHNVRGGDSGSPVLIPVADGWALVGMISGMVWDADLLTQIIAVIDNQALGVPSGHAITVAPDPTL